MANILLGEFDINQVSSFDFRNKLPDKISLVFKETKLVVINQSTGEDLFCYFNDIPYEGVKISMLIENNYTCLIKIFYNQDWAIYK